MKRKLMIFIIYIFMITLCGCKNNNILDENKDPNAPVNLKDVTGPIVKANLDEQGNIIINEDDITNVATYISYEYEEVTIGLIAVRDSKGDIKVVINTCYSCGGAPYAYFVQVDNMLQCQNCGNLFAIDSLGTLTPDGCNPIAIDNISKEGKTITIGTEQLKDLKGKFENWKGPKI